MSESSSLAPSDDEEPRVLAYVKALVDYVETSVGAPPDVLNFRAGETIGVTNWDDDVWWLGCVVDELLAPSSEVGVFPAKYDDGEPLVERFPPGLGRAASSSEEGAVDMSYTQQYVDDDYSPRNAQVVGQARSTVHSGEELPVLFFAKAVLDFEAPEHDPPHGWGFRAGDIIGVTNSSDEIWWSGCVVDPFDSLPATVPASGVGEFPIRYSGGELLVQHISSWGGAGPEPEPEPEPERELRPSESAWGAADSAATTDILIEGRLEKKGGSFTRRWQERYFVLLTDGRLAYWDNARAWQETRQPNGQFLVDASTEVSSIDSERFGFVLTISAYAPTDTERRPLTLRATSQSAVVRWLESIHGLSAASLLPQPRLEMNLNAGRPQADKTGGSDDVELTHQFSREHRAALSRLWAEQQAQEEIWRTEDARQRTAELDNEADADTAELERTMSQIEEAERARLPSSPRGRADRQSQRTSSV